MIYKQTKGSSSQWLPFKNDLNILTPAHWSLQCWNITCPYFIIKQPNNRYIFDLWRLNKTSLQLEVMSRTAAEQEKRSAADTHRKSNYISANSSEAKVKVGLSSLETMMISGGFSAETWQRWKRRWHVCVWPLLLLPLSSGLDMCGRTVMVVVGRNIPVTLIDLEKVTRG